MVERLTPPSDVYLSYMQQVASTLDLLRDREWKQRPSRVFADHSFLVAYTEGSGASRLLKADVDASAFFEVVTDWAHMPHHVRCRRTDLRHRSRQFQAILEHEYVHLCQYLSRGAPPAVVAPGSIGAASAAAERIWMEVEAYFVESVFFEVSPSSRDGLSVEHWVLLRAMTPLLEQLASLSGADEASLEEWARVGKSALGEVRGRLLAEEADLWTPALHEVGDRLPHYAGVAWERGQAQKPERPQP